MFFKAFGQHKSNWQTHQYPTLQKSNDELFRNLYQIILGQPNSNIWGSNRTACFACIISNAVFSTGLNPEPHGATHWLTEARSDFSELMSYGIKTVFLHWRPNSLPKGTKPFPQEQHLAMTCLATMLVSVSKIQLLVTLLSWTSCAFGRELQYAFQPHDPEHQSQSC